MTVKRREGSKTYYTDFSHLGKRIRKCTGTTKKVQAQEYEDKLKEQLWRQNRLGERQAYTWYQAVQRYVEEKTNEGETIEEQKLAWLTQHIGDVCLTEINLETVKALTESLRKEKGVTNGTINKYFNVLRAILRRAAFEWQDSKGKHYWLDKPLRIKKLKEPPSRNRIASEEEIKRLINACPKHLKDPVLLSLATGLRKSNVLLLEWSEVDLEKGVLDIPADKMKSGKRFLTVISQTAISILKRNQGMHEKFVFLYRNRPFKNFNNKTWQRIIKRAGITGLRCHDLRHTWATIHANNGTHPNLLAKLGAWNSRRMLDLYINPSNKHLVEAANNCKLKIEEI